MVNFTSSKILASYFHLFNQILTDADCFFKQIASNFNYIKMIGDNVDIAGGSGVIKNIPNNSKVMGYPAKNIREFLKENR